MAGKPTRNKGRRGRDRASAPASAAGSTAGSSPVALPAGGPGRPAAAGRPGGLVEPPPDLPVDAAAFSAMPVDMRKIVPPAGVLVAVPPGDREGENSQAPPAGLPPVESALKRLGPLPFPRGAVPLMGLFASLYDHVTESARRFASSQAVQTDSRLTWRGSCGTTE